MRGWTIESLCDKINKLIHSGVLGYVGNAMKLFRFETLNTSQIIRPTDYHSRQLHSQTHIRITQAYAHAHTHTHTHTHTQTHTHNNEMELCSALLCGGKVMKALQALRTLAISPCPITTIEITPMTNGNEALRICISAANSNAHVSLTECGNHTAL